MPDSYIGTLFLKIWYEKINKCAERGACKAPIVHQWAAYMHRKAFKFRLVLGFTLNILPSFWEKNINENLKHMKHESWFRTYRVNKMTHKIFSNLRKHSEVSQCIVLTHSYNTTETNGGHVLGCQKQRQTCHNLADFCVSQMIWTACILTCTLVRGQHRLLLFCCWIWIPLCETPGWLCEIENIFKTFCIFGCTRPFNYIEERLMIGQ